ncbi:MAG: M1 family aminopeptidase [Bacteroidota bacterium]
MTNRRFFHVLHHECLTILRLPVFWVLFFVALAITMSVNPAALIPRSQIANSGELLFVNSKFVLAQYFALSGFFTFALLGSVIAGLSVIRDLESNNTQILHSTPLTAFTYIAGKFAGIVCALVVALVIHMLIAGLIYELRPMDDPMLTTGPFHLSNYLIASVVFAFPGMLFFSGAAFAVGTITRKPMAVYAVGAVLFILTMRYCVVSSPATVGPTLHAVYSYLDPSGLRWLIHDVFALEKGITFYNTAPLGLDATFIGNRVLMLGFVLLFVSAAALYFRGWLRRGGAASGLFKVFKKKKAVATLDALEASPHTFADLRGLSMSNSKTNGFASLFRLVSAEFRELYRQPVVYVFGFFILALVTETAVESAEGILGATAYLTAGSIAVAGYDIMVVLLCMLLLFYVIEQSQRDTVTRFSDLLYTTPVSTVTLMLSRLVIALVLCAGIVVVGIAGALMLLLAQGSAFVEVGPFLLIWGALLGTTLFLWISFVLLMLSVFRNRYVVYGIGIMALGISTYMHVQDQFTWANNWDLLGTLHWSEMGLFSLSGMPLLLNRIWAFSLAGALFVLAVMTMQRTRLDSLALLGRMQLQRVGRLAIRILPLFVLPLVLSGYISHQINEGFQGDKAEAVEKNYRQMHYVTWNGYKPPSMIAVHATVDLYPEARAMDVDGVFEMVNDRAVAMPALPFTAGHSFDAISWTFNGTAIEAEERAGLHVLRPAIPIQPGDTLRVGFSYRSVYPRGFTRNGGGMRHFVLPSGVLVSTMRGEFLPEPGFDAQRGMSGDVVFAPANYADMVGHLDVSTATEKPTLFSSKLQVSAPAAYEVTATGVEMSRQTAAGRTVTTWETPAPISVINVMAGKWAVEQADDVAVYYHPEHTYNVETMLDAMGAAKEHFGDWFAPYPWQELRINEYPAFDNNATGFPINISFSESIGFMTKDEAGAYLPYVVTAHEVAHQWWGHMISPAEAPGADFLIEGMANYSALMLVEEEKGREAREAFLRYMEQQYIRRRRADREVPLLENIATDTQGEVVAYNKGAWVMWMLQQQMGREALIAGLHGFTTTYNVMQDTMPAALPTLQDMLNHLRAQSLDAKAFDAFVAQWFGEVALPRFQLSKVTREQVDGMWEVRGTIVNAGTGVVPTEVSVVQQMPDYERRKLTYEGEIAIETVVVHTDEGRTFTIRTAFEPEGVLIDPHLKVLQRDRYKAMFNFDE